MVSINGSTITMTRGDTLEVQIELFRPDGGRYPPQPGDVIYKPPSDGFITITKDNAGVAGIRTCLFCLTEMVRRNE